MIKPRIYSYKNSSNSLFDNIGVDKEMTAFTDQIFTRLKPKFKITVCFLFEIIDKLCYLFPHFFDISRFFTIPIRNLKTTSHIDVFDILKIFKYIKHDL